MINKENYMGKITISDEYIRTVVRNTVSDCFGIAGLVPVGFMEALRKNSGNHGISIEISENRLRMELHIAVTMGTNIPAVVQCLRNKLKFVLSDSMGMELERVNIFIDEIVS